MRSERSGLIPRGHTGKVRRMSAIEKMSRWISPEEYLAGERVAEVRHEYVDGEVFAMAGESKQHNTIAFNIMAWLHSALRGKPCRSYMENVKVRINPQRTTLFYYPDVYVTCDPRDTDDYFSDYPCVIFEVLSPATARTDQREKRRAYQKIETMQTCVLVEQGRIEVTVWQRGDDGWKATVFDERTDEIALPALGLKLPVAEIYAEIETAS